MDWTVTHSRYVLTDRWLSVRADSCRTAAGQVVEPYCVFEYPDWVNVVALTDAQEVILVRQYRHGIGKRSSNSPAEPSTPKAPHPSKPHVVHCSKNLAIRAHTSIGVVSCLPILPHTTTRRIASWRQGAARWRVPGSTSLKSLR